MKKKIIFVLTLSLLLFLVIAFSEKELPEEVEVVSIDKNIQEMSSEEVDVFLQSMEDMESEERLKKIINLRIGTPYERGCLGEEGGIDPNPIFRLDVTDCTVFMLTSTALLNASSKEEARELMGSLNYYPVDSITYEDRLHFSTYRNLVSPYFEDITREVGEAEKKTVVLNKKRADGTRLIDIDFEETVEINYIPVSADFELPSVVGVAFLRHGDEQIGLDVRHEGFVVEGKDLIHASLNKGEVVKENFLEYLSISEFDGLIFFKIKSF